MKRSTRVAVIGAGVGGLSAVAISLFVTGFVWFVVAGAVGTGIGLLVIKWLEWRRCAYDI